METVPLSKFWSVIYAVLREFWAITEPHIEEAAVRNNIPIELYYYAELGSDHFSVGTFQERDPFSNPELFERQFVRLEIKDWIVPFGEHGRYRVTERSQEGTRLIVQAGDAPLVKFGETCEINLERLLSFLKQIVLANNAAPEPPEKRAIVNRFRVATGESPAIVQIRECLMDVLAYRDDCHLSAARPQFNQAGIVWSAFGSVCNGAANTAEKIAEINSFHGYEVTDYAAALRAAVEVGWLEETETKGVFRPTASGQEMHDRVEKMTDHYFYRPWATLSQTELDELYALLVQLRQELHGFGKNT